MVFTLSRRGKTGTIVALVAASALALSACSADTDAEAPADENTSAPEETSSGEWPRTFENADGTTTEIPEQPERIASTSVSITGTLLAIDAPVIASGSAGNGQFFAQWAEIADERAVDNLWPAGSVDLEAIIGQDPDLIVVSTSSADSAVDQLDEFQSIAPTIVLDFGGQTWQELAIELGQATGLEDQAELMIADFDELVESVSEQITVPDGQANIISFNGPGENNPIALPGSAQGQLLQALGFTLEEPDPAWHTQAETRSDFVWASYENLTELTAETSFILSVDDEGAQTFATDPLLANLPSIQAGQVYGLGANSFRVDPFSATEIVEGVLENFGGN